MKHNILDIQEIFHKTFRENYKTQLIFGADEPFYQSKSTSHESIIHCREDFFASALHEIAHWCLAGEERRKLDDYGFWYSPDGRNLEKQKEFEKVEVKPQAIEKHFSIACHYPFKPSVDNLSLENYDSSRFLKNIEKQFDIYKKSKLPKRAQLFYTALCDFYQDN